MRRYFHLLSDEEVERLEVVMRIVRDNRAGILDSWYELYELHFGSERTFSRPEFDTYFGADLDAVVAALLERDIALLEDSVRKVGRRFLARGVPFAEIIASMHLFEESCASFFRRRLTVLARGPDIFLTFDKLSHVRMILLADTYYASEHSAREARARGLERDLQRLDPNAHERTTFHGLVGASPGMRRLYEQVQAVAATGATILITGESGTGKELLARAVHEAGSPPAAPFVALNCAALPQDLIESELFGHRRGAFSGATADALGLVRAADGGTLFLDEITEMPLPTQAKLLRVLQERVVRPVGATSEIAVRVRFIASTNRPVRDAMAAGRLREDLYYRLQGHTLALPPLRDRLDDIPLLVEHCIDVFNQREGRRVGGIEPEALRVMQSYSWPGNVRELMTAIEAAFTYGNADRIRLEDLPLEVRGDGGARAPSTSESRGALAGSVTTFEESERALLQRALDSTQGNKVRAAKMLGISRKQLYAKLKKYAIAAAD